MREATTRCDEELKHIVKAGRVTLARRNEREKLLQIIADDIALHVRLTGTQTIEVTAQRIDFAVVSEVTERVRERPSRECVRGVTLVNKRNRRFEIEIVQILVKTFNLACQKQALVHNATAAAAANVEALASLFQQAANNIEFNIKRAVGIKSGTVKESLADMRQSLAGRMANLLGIHRHLAEVQQLHALGSGNFLDFCIKSGSLKRIVHKEHGHAIALWEFRVHLAEKLVRHRKQKTRTVAGFRVSTCCTTVHEPLQNSNTLQHNLVRGNIINISDQADTTGVVFVHRIVKSLSVHKCPFLAFCAHHLQNPCQFLKTPANY